MVKRGDINVETPPEKKLKSKVKTKEAKEKTAEELEAHSTTRANKLVKDKLLKGIKQK